MGPCVGIAALGIVTGAVICLLYWQGIAATKCIAAVLFSFRPGKGQDKAALDACSGWVRHAGRFKESGTYTFTLDLRLTKGHAAVSLLDGKKRELLRLDRCVRTGAAELYRENRYYLRWEFESATGTCALCWENHPMMGDNE